MTPVVTIADLDRMEVSPKGEAHETFGASIADITGKAAESFGLGAMHVRVKPGKRAFPFHNHLANPEMFIILEGAGTYRFGPGEYPVKAGDVCLAPRGGPETAHQLINTGTGDLVYIGLSTLRDPEIVEYPDSGKFSVLGIFPGESFYKAHLNFIGRRDQTTDYWDGET